MSDVTIYLLGLGGILIAAVLTWVLSIIKRDASIVDSMWSVFFIVASAIYFTVTDDPAARAVLVLSLVLLWGLRLSAYITWRNWGEAEDSRYQAMRSNNEPNFALKSLYIVFGLQALLAWLISLPLLSTMISDTPINALDYIGMTLWFIGMVFEVGGDYQLARFKTDPRNKGKVMDKGFWRYTRHPNYFGEFCIWWGFYLLAFASGAWWAIVSPLLMTLLLLRVSGVALLEKDIGQRRPAYRDYILRTNAFFPGPPRQAQTKTVSES